MNQCITITVSGTKVEWLHFYRLTPSEEQDQGDMGQLRHLGVSSSTLQLKKPLYSSRVPSPTKVQTVHSKIHQLFTGFQHHFDPNSETRTDTDASARLLKSSTLVLPMGVNCDSVLQLTVHTIYTLHFTVHNQF